LEITITITISRLLNWQTNVSILAQENYIFKAIQVVV